MLDLLSPNPTERAAHWSLELLGDLEWNRFQHLVSRLLHRVGYLPELAWIRPDGAVALSLLHPGRPQQLEAIIQCAPWLGHDIDASALHELHQVVVHQGAQRGIYVTPGTFSSRARAFSRMKPLELVDGRDLLRTLEQIPTGEQDYLMRLTAMGSYSIPTCPSCAKTMELVDNSAAPYRPWTGDMTYKDHHFETREVHCQSLTIKESADVVFTKSVTTRSMSVSGKATGNIVVNGRLRILQGGWLSGLVSARAIQLDPGGNLEAEARILNGSDLPLVQPIPAIQVWRCPAWPKCRATLPLRQT